MTLRCCLYCVGCCFADCSFTNPGLEGQQLFCHWIHKAPDPRDSSWKGEPTPGLTCSCLEPSLAGAHSWKPAHYLTRGNLFICDRGCNNPFVLLMFCVLNVNVFICLFFATEVFPRGFVGRVPYFGVNCVHSTKKYRHFPWNSSKKKRREQSGPKLLFSASLCPTDPITHILTL